MGVALIVKGVNFSNVGLGEVTKKSDSSSCDCNCNCNNTQQYSEVKKSNEDRLKSYIVNVKK